MSLLHTLGHATLHHAAKDPVGTTATMVAVLSNPVTWEVAAVAGVTYLIYKACTD